METDHGDVARDVASRREQVFDGSRMTLGQQPLNRSDLFLQFRFDGAHTEQGAQARAETPIVGSAGEGHGTDFGFAVALDQGSVDAVERGPAHQTDGE